MAKRTDIRIPKCIITRKLELSSDEFFAIVALSFTNQDACDARFEVAGPLRAIDSFNTGFSSLVSRAWAKTDGDLSPLWQHVISNRLGFVRTASAHFVPTPFPYISFRRNVLAQAYENNLRKTAFMILLAQSSPSTATLTDSDLAEFCGVSRTPLYAAKMKLQELGLWSRPERKVRQQKLFVVQGEAEQDEVETIVASLQEGITFEAARAEGLIAATSGLPFKSMSEAVPSFYEAYLRQRSSKLDNLLKSTPTKLGRIPRVYIKGFTDGWNHERVQRGLDPERFADL